jgi:hypothetical protein
MWSDYAYVFDQHTGQLTFMVVEGKQGAHVELLNKYGSGSIYRLCFTTDRLVDQCFHHLQAHGIQLTNLEGVPFHSFQDVRDSGERILWLEREGAMSMEIRTGHIIDAGCEKLVRQKVGLVATNNTGTKALTRLGQLTCGVVSALGSALFVLGFLLGRASLPKW